MTVTVTVTVTSTPRIQRGRKYNSRVVAQRRKLDKGMRVDHEGTTYILARAVLRGHYYVVASGEYRYWFEYHFTGKEQLDKDIAALDWWKRWLSANDVPTKGLDRPSFR